MQIIFVTGFLEHAQEGYEVDALSYLLKPVKKERLFACLDKAESRLGGREGILICTGDVALRILLPFLTLALPGVVVACLEGNGREPVRIFLTMLYVGIWQGIRLAQGYVEELRHRKLFLMRLGCGTDFFGRCLNVDGQFLESAQGQEKLAAASENLYSGTERGIEVYLEAFLSLLVSLGGLLVYGTILAGEHPLLLLFLALQAIPVIGMNMRAGKRSFRLAGENDHNWDMFLYLRRESVSPSNGKDIRMYRMDRWFLRAFGEVTNRFVKGRVREKEGFVAAGITEKVISFLRDILVYGYLIRQMGLGLISVPVFLVYVGAAAGFGGWMSGMFTSLQDVRMNDPVLSRYREFMEEDDTTEWDDLPGPRRAGAGHEIRMTEGKTSVYISHRMSSCRFCDDILVFEEGRIVERGSHESLLAQNGQYAGLWRAQARYYA